MRIDIVTIFPEIAQGPLHTSILGRAVASGRVEIRIHDLRDFTTDRHRQVDDLPYGGGPGMVMKPEPFFAAVSHLKTEGSKVLLMTPQGRPFRQSLAVELSRETHLILLCGHYEGVDHRVVEALVDEEISIGDYVLAGGEAAALVVIEAVTRLLPGVVGNPDSVAHESFRDGLLEEPVYTKPAEYRGLRVPEVLLSGDHARIQAWREEQRRLRTRERRPDLWERFVAGSDS